MTIGKVNIDGHVRVSFDQTFVFNLPDSRRNLAITKDLSDLSSLNEGSEIISVEYQPSFKSLDLQERSSGFVQLEWEIEVIDDLAFDIVLLFTFPEKVSQYNNNLDRVRIEII